MAIKYCSVCYFSNPQQGYTYKYSNRKHIIEKGDFVIVPTPKGNTVAKVYWAEVDKPSFECKIILQKVKLDV